jgi:hypothetical protein
MDKTMHLKSTPLFFTRKKTLLDGFADFLKSQMVDCIPLLIGDIAELATHHSDFEKCDLVLFDINEDPLFLELAAQLHNEVSSFVPLVAVKSTDELPNHVRLRPEYLHLAGVANVKKGWGPAWDKIMEIRCAWKTPSMHSRIEDVSPSDVLQMIGISQWTVIVRFEGEPSQAMDEATDGSRTRGCVSFVKGVPECAWSTNTIGNAAVWELLSLSHGTLEVIRRVWSCGVHNIEGKIEELLVTFAVRVDESGPPPPELQEPAAQHPVELPILSRWPESKPKIFLDRWWAVNAQGIIQTLGTTKEGIYPLRWMKWRELERLVNSKIQTRFLVILGDEQFVLRHLRPYVKDITAKKLLEEELPVIRLEKFENDYLYLIGIRQPVAALHVLNRFPFVIPGELQPGEFLGAVIKNRVRAAVIITDDAETSLNEVAKTNHKHPINFCCLQAPHDTDGYPVTVVFKHIAESIARMAEEQ